MNRISNILSFNLVARNMQLQISSLIELKKELFKLEKNLNRKDKIWI